MSFIYLGIEYSCNFIFGFTFYFNRRGRRLNSIRNNVWNGRFKHGDMENGVNGAEGFRKSERKGMGNLPGQ